MNSILITEDNERTYNWGDAKGGLIAKSDLSKTTFRWILGRGKTILQVMSGVHILYKNIQTYINYILIPYTNPGSQ